MTAVRDVRRLTWSAREVLTGNLRISGNFSEVTTTAAHMSSTPSESVPKAASFKRQRASDGRWRLYLPPSVCSAVMFLRRSSLLSGVSYRHHGAFPCSPSFHHPMFGPELSRVARRDAAPAVRKV